MDSIIANIGVAQVVATCALLFTVLTFWWMNWRRASLVVGPPPNFVAAGEKGKTAVVYIPLVFFNPGPTPHLVQDLRLRTTAEGESPFRLVATHKRLMGPNEERAYAIQIVVRGRDAVNAVYEFQQKDAASITAPGKHEVILEALILGESRWNAIARFSLNTAGGIGPGARGFENSAE